MKRVLFLVLLAPLSAGAQREMPGDPAGFAFTRENMRQQQCITEAIRADLAADYEAARSAINNFQHDWFRYQYRRWQTQWRNGSCSCPISYTMLPLLKDRSVASIRKYLTRRHWELSVSYSDSVKGEHTEIYAYRPAGSGEGNGYLFIVRYRQPNGTRKAAVRLRSLAISGPRRIITDEAAAALSRQQYQAVTIANDPKGSASRYHKHGYTFVLGELPDRATEGRNYFVSMPL